MKKKAIKFILFIVSIVLLFYISIFGYLIFSAKFKSYTNQVPFHSETWKSHLADKDTVKQQMVKDLLSNYNLVGMSKTEIVSLLGLPPQTQYFKDYHFVYWLGPEQSLISIDSEWLGIQFDSADQVVRLDLLKD